MPRVVVFTGPMKLAQRALQILYLALVVNFLAFGQFQRFQHLFHLLKRMLQFLDDAVDLLDRVGNRRLPVLLQGRFRTLAPFHWFRAFRSLRSFRAFCAFGASGRFRAFKSLRLLAVFSVLRMFRVFFSRVLNWFGRRFCYSFRVLAVGFCGRGRIAGRGHGAAVIPAVTASGMAATAAS